MISANVSAFSIGKAVGRGGGVLDPLAVCAAWDLFGHRTVVAGNAATLCSSGPGTVQRVAGAGSTGKCRDGHEAGG